MEIKIIPIKNKKEIGKIFGAYIYKTHTIELCTRQIKSTINTLIHEIHHQCLHEIVNKNTSVKYDKIYQDLERYIFDR